VTFDRLWADLAPVGRAGSAGGYRRYAWTPADAALTAVVTDLVAGGSA
jgi:beta-ureidopropionase / N-carbamoyl-L-amino-acid hydrolase